VTPSNDVSTVVVSLIVDGVVSSSNAMNVVFNYMSTSSVESLSPTIGSPKGGMEVSVQGSGFTALVGTPSCRFGSVDVVATIDSDTRVRCNVPPSEVEGSTKVSIHSSSGDVLSGSLSFL
jgi:hypothetical protein